MATYWIELSHFAAEESWGRDILREVGIDFLESGPVTEYTTFWKVLDPGADPGLEGKTVNLTFGQEIHDPDAIPPVYTYTITNREERSFE